MHDPRTRALPSLGGRGMHRHRSGVQGNARLTAITGTVLFVLLAAEGLTILRVRALLSPHVFIGMMLIPPVALKLGSTVYRFGRYYLRHPHYRRKGPPPLVLRLLGPVVAATTVAVLASGVALVYVPRSDRATVLFLHQASFVVWFAATAIHVLGHAGEAARLTAADLVGRTRRAVTGATFRWVALALSLLAGIGLGVVVVGRAAAYVVSVR